ncbi:MAG: DNA N-6-adenine-methyltransferase [Candidatus Gastranaerophilaceae bacterium]
MKYKYDADRQDYLTPEDFIKQVLSYYNREEFDLDTCCSQKNIPAKQHFIYPKYDGLKMEWQDFNWCNPPYKYCEKWIKKAYHEQIIGHSTVMLIPARTETKYWHDYIFETGFAIRKNVQIRFLRKGLRFVHPETKEAMGIYKNALAIVYFKGC